MRPEGFDIVTRHARSALVALFFALFSAAPPAGAIPVPSVDWGGSAMGAPRSLRASLHLGPERLRGYGIERPARLAFDEEGALYVLDSRARRVVRLAFLDAAAEGVVFGDDAPASALPHDLALDLRGSLLVLDRSRATVAGYDRRASYLGTRDIDGGLADEVRAPSSRLLRDPFGDLWLLAPQVRDIVPLDARLLRKRQDRFLSPEDSLGDPAAAVFLPQGGGWIADRGAGRLQRFDATGRIRFGVRLEPVPGASGDAATTGTPVDLAVDPSGALYVADMEGSRIVILDRDGRVLQTRWLGGEERPWHPGAIAWGPLDKIAVADESKGEIWIFEVERGGAP